MMKNGDMVNHGTTGIGPVNPLDKEVSATRLPAAERSEVGGTYSGGKRGGGTGA